MGVKQDQILTDEQRRPDLQPYKRILPSAKSREKLRQRGYTWVLSSNVSAVGASGNSLYIRFHNGSVYEYPNQAENMEDMLDSASKGRWVWDNLRRRRVSYRKVTEMPLDEDIDYTDEAIMIPAQQVREVERLTALNIEKFKGINIKTLDLDKKEEQLDDITEPEGVRRPKPRNKEEAIERSKKAKTYEKEVDSYNDLFDTTKEAWKEWSDDEKRSISGYSQSDYYDINELTTGRLDYSELDEDNVKYYKRSIKNIENAIKKAPRIKEDMKVYRDTQLDELQHHFNITEEDIRNNNFEKYEGVEYVDKSFKSTYTSDEKSFFEKWGEEQDVVVEIFTPEGTQGAYIEPFSHQSNQEDGLRGADWDGETKADTTQGIGENEMILQRNSKYRVLSIRKEKGLLKVEVEVMGVEEDE